LLLPDDLLKETLWAFVLFTCIMLVLMFTKVLYKYMVKRNLKVNVAIYYNRKLIHVLAGGVTAFLVPYVFTSPLIPTVFALTIAAILYVPHRRKNVMEWFQVSDNAYEVNFCVAWGLSLLALWLITGNPRYAIIPPLFMSIGDAVTGIIRNSVYGRRTKSWLGNLGMLAVTVPIGLHYAGIPGIVAAAASTVVEHFEIPPFLDDNVLIALTSVLVLTLFRGYWTIL